MFLNNLSMVRSIEWSKSFLWDVCFDSTTTSKYTLAPFNKWLPAIAYTDNLAVVKTQNFTGTMTNFTIPTGSNVKTFSLTFIDDIDLTLLNWFRLWINRDILNYGQGLSPLANILRTINILHVNNSLDTVYNASYKVFPTSTVTYPGGEGANGNIKFTVNFVKVVIMKEEYSKASLFSIQSVASNVLNKIVGGFKGGYLHV